MSKKMPAWFNRECGGRVPARAPGGLVKPGSGQDSPVEQAGVLDSVARGAARLLGRKVGPSKSEIDQAYKTLDKYKAPPPRETPKMSTEDAARYFEKDGAPGVADFIRKGAAEGRKRGGKVKK